jgi:DNA-binding transcriptional ArsR family regulator
LNSVELLLNDPKTVKALAHPLRAKLLAMLDRREASPSQLANEIGEPLGTVSYHVRTLHDLGLLRLVGEKRQRGAVEHYYTGVKWVVPDRVWKALPESLRGTVHQSFLSQISEDVSAAASSGGFDEAYSLLNRDVLTLDEAGALQLEEELSMLAERALAIEAECKERLAKTGSEPQKAHLVLMLFGTPEKKSS